MRWAMMAAGAVLLGACGGAEKRGGTATTGGRLVDPSGTQTYVRPLPFWLSFHCADSSTLELEVTAAVQNGAQAIVDFADTGNATSYYEAHALQPSATSEEGTTFVGRVGTGASYVAGMSSVFSCAPGVHFDEARAGEVMSYVVRSYDSGGRLDDCYASGQDPAGMLGKSYPDFGNTLQHGDITAANCVTVRKAR
mgnify:FL=1